MQGVISGSGGIKKTGATGDAAIWGTNTYTGVTSIEQGLLIAYSNGALGDPGASSGTAVSAGASLVLNPLSGGVLNIASEPLSIAGNGGTSYGALISASGTNTYGGPITLAAAASIGSISSQLLTVSGTVNTNAYALTLNGTGDLNVSGVISGTGELKKQGNFTATLSVANTYTGATSVNAGTLKLGAATNAITTTSATTVANGATLDVNGKAQTLSAGLASSGTLALGTGGTLTLSGGTSTIGAVTGNGKIVVGSGATLTLTSALVNGNVEIELAGGTLNLGNFTHNIGKLTVSTASTLDFSGTSTSASPSRITTATLALGGNALSVTNWTRGTDRFYATAFTGAAANRQGAATTPVDHPHNFVAGTSGSLMLGIAVESANASSANASWSGTIHADPGCTGKVQSGAAQLYPGGTTIPVVQGQTVCVVVREVAPAGTDNGTVNQTTVWATLGFSNANPTLSASYTLVDTTTVGNSALVLLKEVRNVTTGGAWGTSNQAKSGQVLEYRVTYTNTTTSPMTKVTIGDSAPAYTVFQSATAGTVPGDLGACTMNTPANPAPAAAVDCATVQPVGGTGAIRWLFDGRLNPGASGDVGFRVKVE